MSSIHCYQSVTQGDLKRLLPQTSGIIISEISTEAYIPRRRARVVATPIPLRLSKIIDRTLRTGSNVELDAPRAQSWSSDILPKTISHR